MKMKTLNSNIEAVIFDLDGTLADSMWMWADIDKEYLSRFGFKPDSSLGTDIAGLSMEETAAFFKEHYGIEDSIEQIVQDWIDMSIDSYRHKVRLKPYAAEALRFFKAHGMKMAIASSNGIDMVRACLKSNGIEDYFADVVTSSEVPHGKPSPDVYLLAAERIGADPSACLVFEDIPVGLMAGRAAGMKVIGVRDDWSAGSENEMRELADMYFEGFEDFLRAEGATGKYAEHNSN